MLRCLLKTCQKFGPNLRGRPLLNSNAPSITKYFHRLSVDPDDDRQFKPGKQIKREHRKNSNEEPLGKKRTWNVSQGAVKKLREDVINGKGYIVYNISRRPNPAYGFKYIKHLFSKEREHNEIKDSLKNLSNSELKEVMAFMSKSKNSQDLLKNFKFMEAECCQRLKSLSIDDRLFIADLFFVSGYPASHYFEQLFSTVEMEWDSTMAQTALDSKKVIQLLFYIGVYRNGPVFLFSNIEKYLSANVHKYSGRELGLVCNSFFASNQSIRNVDLLKGISHIVLKDLEIMPLYLVTNVLKAFRHAHFRQVDFYEKLADELCGVDNNLISTSYPAALSNTLSTYASLQIRHEPLFREAGRVVQHYISEKSKWNVRAKDLTRILWSYSSLQHPPPPGLIESLIESLQGFPAMLQMYPEVYTEAMISLAMNDVYIHNMLNEMFSPQSLAARKRRLLEQEHQILLIDEATGLEQPQYNGCRLPKDFHTVGSKTNKEKLGLALNRRHGLAVTWWTLQKLLGDHTKIRCRHVFKYSNVADLEMWLDEENRPMIIPDSHAHFNTEEELQLCKTVALGMMREKGEKSFSVSEQLMMEQEVQKKSHFARGEPPLIHILAAQEQEMYKKHLNEPLRRVILKVTSWNQYALNSPTLMGLPQMELRLLSRTGYEVLVIDPKKAQDMETMTCEQRQAFIQKHVIQQLNINL